MKRTLSWGAIALLMLPVAAVQAEAPNVHEALIAAKSPSVVSIKMVLAVSGSVRGRSVEQEINHSATGVVVDKSGLIMVASGALNPLPANLRAMVKAVPTNIRIIYPGDEKEYDAILGATDSKLGLGFILAKDLTGRDAQALDLSKGITPTIGQKLYGVSRMGQGFDYAPMCDIATITGKLTKPRKVWVLARANSFRAKPLYDAAGAVAGIVVAQEGVGENAGTQTCLLPLDVAQSTITRSLKAAQDALEEALEAEAEAAEIAKEEAEAAKEEDGAKEDGDAEDDDKKSDAEKDAPKAEPKKGDEPKKADEPKKDAPKADPKKADEPKKESGV